MVLGAAQFADILWCHQGFVSALASDIMLLLIYIYIYTLSDLNRKVISGIRSHH